MPRHLLLFALSVAISACGDAGSDTSGATDPNPTTPFTTTGADASTSDPASTSNAPESTGGTPTTGDASTTDAAETTGVDGTCADLCRNYEAAFPTVASDITDKAATDPMFMSDFAPLVAQGAPAVDAFKESLANFISDAYGCSMAAYTGPSMEAAHAGLGITQLEYDAFIALIVDVLTDNGVPQQDISDCFAPPLVDPSFANTIIGH